MKRKLLAWLLVVCMILPMLPTALAADTVASGTCGENLTWVLDDEGTLTISGMGAMPNYEYYISSGCGQSTSPFNSGTAIKTVVVEDGVTSIGSYAFYCCNNLISITIPDSVTSIGNLAFYECRNLTEITIPDSVISIGNFAFSECRNLTEITIPDSVTSIGNWAFNWCRNLTEITIPDSVTSIGDGAFEGCDNLTSITISDSVTSIGYCTFHGCDNLTSVTIPDSVTSIGDHAFHCCINLTSITIPDSVTSIGDCAFVYCSSLTSVTIPDSVTSIGGYAFRDCKSLTSVTIPSSVTSIENGSFDYCTSLTDVYYSGSQGDWNQITIAGNTLPTGATIHFDSTVPDDPYFGEAAVQKYFTDQHLSFIQSDTYEYSINAEWSKCIKEGLDTKSSNAAEVMYNILNSASELMSFQKLTIFDNPYDVIITDLILDMSETEQEAFSARFELKSIEMMDQLETLCGFFDESNDYGANDDEFHLKLEKLFADPKDYASEEPAFYQTCTKLFGKMAENDDELNKLLNLYGKASDIQGMINDGAKVVEWVVECFRFNAVVSAFIETSDQFKKNLQTAEGLMTSFAGLSAKEQQYASAYSESLEKFFAFTDEDLTDSDITALLFEEYTANGFEKIGEVFGSALVKEAVKWGTKGLGLTTTTILAIVDAYQFGWKAGQFITQNDGIMQCRELLRANFYLCEALGAMADLYATELQRSESYDDAIRFDSAWSMLQHSEIYSLSTYRKYLDYQNQGLRGAKNWITHGGFKYDFNKTEFEAVDKEIALWESAVCHDPDITNAVQDCRISLYKVCCPTDVFVYDSDDKIVLSIENNEITCRRWGIAANVYGDMKILAIPNAENYTVKILSTDDGTMSYSQSVCNYNNELIISKNYTNIPISKNDSFQSTYKIEDNTVELKKNNTVVQPTSTITDEDSIVLVSSITFAEHSTVLKIGDTMNLHAIVSPDYATCQALQWQSSDDGVLSVDEAGKVTALKAGTATITCRTVDGSGLYTESAITVKSSAKPVFSDVSDRAYYAPAVAWAVEHGITAGTSATTFSPDKTCTRAQVVTFLWRAAGEPEPTSTANPFTDVKPGAYYYKAVLWAVENGITAGTSKTKFSPEQGCTRAQVATFLYRAAGEPKPSSGNNPFTDVKAGAYYYNAVQWAVENGITKGTSSTKYSPNVSCTRAQIVTFLYRAYA